jgi:hypothetical protein
MARLGKLLSPHGPALLVMAMLVTFNGVAAADPTLVGTTTDPTGIKGLLVGGQLYDVTFSTKSYDSLFTGAAPPPTFLNSPNVFLTETALSSFFGSSHVTSLGGGACGGTTSCAVFVPSGVVSVSGTVTTNGAFTAFGQHGSANGAGDPGLDVTKSVGKNTVATTGTYYEYAVFTPRAAHVPAPDMLGVTAVALVAIALARRRREMHKTNC